MTTFNIAIVGAGPSGFYAADHLLKQRDDIAIDLFDRLPTPFGLVRYGVAPDHPKIKSVTKTYARTAKRPEVRFFGNVNIGTDVTRTDLEAHYHAVIYTTGAQTDRMLNIPGIDLDGSYAATEFVAWYNGHPDYRDHQFDLSVEHAYVIGVGNVALDVARILLRTQEELQATDIAQHALEALAKSNIKQVTLVGRRGPAQAAFTFSELKELGELAGADFIIDAADMTLDPVSQAAVEKNKKSRQKYELMAEMAQREPTGKPKQLFLKFLRSPSELNGDEVGHVSGITLERNDLIEAPDGRLRARGTGYTRTYPAGLVLRSIGYRGVAVPDIPFDEKYGILPNVAGRVGSANAPVIGHYTAGWIKRGPSGVIGTNRPDAGETVKMLSTDLDAGTHLSPSEDDITALLKARNVDFIDWDAWERLDAAEVAAGESSGRPRIKATTVAEMLTLAFE